MWVCLPALTRQPSSLSSPSLQMLLTLQPGSFAAKFLKKIISSTFAAMGKHLVFPSSAGGGGRRTMIRAASQTLCYDWKGPITAGAGTKIRYVPKQPSQLMLPFPLALCFLPMQLFVCLFVCLLLLSFYRNRNLIS